MFSNKIQIKEYKLQSEANAAAIIAPLTIDSKTSHEIDKPHRDDHYLLLFAIEGSYQFHIDFENTSIEAPFIMIIEPGQVHQTLKRENATGWVLGIEIAFLEKELRHFLDNRNNQLTKIQPAGSQSFQQMNGLLSIIYQLQTSTPSLYTSKSIMLLINAVLCLLINQATHASGAIKASSKEKRAYIIEQQFGALLKEKYKEWKSPGQYAKALSLSTAHLNDTIKEVTGKSVSMHIQEQNVTEAKRLLYFTDLEVREVAYHLGFEDPVYFGRLFKKMTTLTPLLFRNKFRD